MSEASAIVERLGLTPHPEGGWYRETWRAPPGPDGRSSATGILFLLKEGERSHWHKVDAAELWLWHAGAPLRLSTAAADSGPVEQVMLGPGVLTGHAPQHLVPPDHWQSAEPERGWALVSCVVVPGFSFDGFTLAPEGWAPGR